MIMKPSISLSNINVIAELEHFGIEYNFASEEELRISCPFHRDSVYQSCFINVNKKTFSCHTSGCERTGDIISLIAAKCSLSRAKVIKEVVYRYAVEETVELLESHLSFLEEKKKKLNKELEYTKKEMNEVINKLAAKTNRK